MNVKNNIKKLKKLYPKIPVVMLTGHGYDNTMMKTAMIKGATSYFSKENDLENLAEMLEYLITKNTVGMKK